MTEESKEHKIKVKNKVSEKDTKDDKVKKTTETIETKLRKQYTEVPKGVGGSFVDIGGGIKVPAHEVNK